MSGYRYYTINNKELSKFTAIAYCPIDARDLLQQLLDFFNISIKLVPESIMIIHGSLPTENEIELFNAKMKSVGMKLKERQNVIYYESNK